MAEPHYYKVRVRGRGSEESPIEPDWPLLFNGAWVGTHRTGDDHFLCMTLEDVSLLLLDRGEALALEELEAATAERDVAFAKVRDEMAVDGIGHPERRVR